MAVNIANFYSELEGEHGPVEPLTAFRQMAESRVTRAGDQQTRAARSTALYAGGRRLTPPPSERNFSIG